MNIIQHMDLILLHDTINEYITKASKKNSPHLIQNGIDQIESHSSILIKDNFESFKINIVIDTNAAITTIKRHIKNEPSIFFHLSKNPLFSLWAPTELKDEVLKYIENKVQKKSKKQWIEGLQTISNTIKFKNNNNVRIKKQAMDIIGKIDPKDVPFVELYLDVNAQAILTSDKHFKHKGIRIFEINDLITITSVFQKGILSHYIVSESIPTGVNFLKEIILAFFIKIFDSIKHVLKITMSKITNVYSQVMEFIKKLPLWQKILIIGGVILLLGWIISSKSKRNKIIYTLDSLTNSRSIIMRILAFLKKSIGELIDFMSYIIPSGTIVITESLNNLLEHIKNMENEFKNLLIQNTFT